MVSILEGRWEKRWHPLRRQWVVYAAHRNTRPWTGDTIKDQKQAESFDEDCYLCPGNKRVSGQLNPNYEGVFIFDNDHPVVGKDAPEIFYQSKYPGLRKVESAIGIAKVICYHPHHHQTLASLPSDVSEEVLISLKSEMTRLSRMPDIKSHPTSFPIHIL